MTESLSYERCSASGVSMHVAVNKLPEARQNFSSYTVAVAVPTRLEANRFCTKYYIKTEIKFEGVNVWRVLQERLTLVFFIVFIRHFIRHPDCTTDRVSSRGRRRRLATVFDRPVLCWPDL